MSDFKVLFDVGLEEGSLATLENQINKIKELGKGTKLFSDIDTGIAISSLKEIESVVKSIEKTKISPKIDTKEIEKLGEAVKEIDKINFSTSLNKLKTESQIYGNKCNRNSVIFETKRNENEEFCNLCKIF